MPSFEQNDALVEDLQKGLAEKEVVGRQTSLDHTGRQVVVKDEVHDVTKVNENDSFNRVCPRINNDK
jgi:hypothetical protein